jgi:coproporphyrinogen III oxidase-like Fe-S oxidoreductase
VTEGVDLGRLARMAGLPRLPDFAYLTELGLAEVGGGRLRATAAGRLVLNGVVARAVEAVEAALSAV